MTAAGTKAIITSGAHEGKEGVFIRFRAATKTMFGTLPATCVIYIGGSTGAVSVAPTDFHTAVCDLNTEALREYDAMYGAEDAEGGYGRVV